MTKISMLLVAVLLGGCGGAAAGLDEREYSDSPIVSATGGASAVASATGGTTVVVATGGATMATGGAATGGSPMATGGAFATGGSQASGGRASTGGSVGTGGSAPKTGPWPTLCDLIPQCADQAGKCAGNSALSDGESIGQGCRKAAQFACGNLYGYVVQPNDPTVVPQLAVFLCEPTGIGTHFCGGATAEIGRYAAVYCAN